MADAIFQAACVCVRRGAAFRQPWQHDARDCPITKTQDAYMIRVLIADDHRIALLGLKHFLTGVSDIHVTGEATNASEVLDHVRHSDFDLLLLDLSMPGSKGLELLHKVKKERPALSVLILSMYDEEEYAATAIRAGALGYLMKGCSRAQLLEAIRRIGAGEPYMSARTAAELDSNAQAEKDLLHLRLSDRQLEVFLLLIHGRSLTEIGDMLQLSVKTVGTHKSHIMQKMGMSTVFELVQYAAKHGLIAGASTV
jgi:DNA-binding NarL/FixJ family response regulator